MEPVYIVIIKTYQNKYLINTEYRIVKDEESAKRICKETSKYVSSSNFISSTYIKQSIEK